MSILNRRHLRIKVLQSLYAYFQSDEEDYVKAERELMRSVEQMYDLYLYLILIYPEVREIAEHRIEERKKKLRPTDDDLNPNRKFVDNAVMIAVENSTELRKVSEERKVNWLGDENKEMFRKLFLVITESESYIHHMNNGISGFEEDKAFAVEIFKNEIANFDLLHSFFEERSIRWLDDIDLVCSMVIKTIRQIEEGATLTLLPLYKKDDDEQEFVKELFKMTVSMNTENEKLIDTLTENWELERIAKMDILLMKMAITELQIFPSIPTKVTLNEYIEISKFYSTPKSNGFINGILDKAIEKLTKEGLIRKTGRGLLQ